ncbi:Innexin inx2 [Halotydeus destructor]|nr:Innexin inx2 [Halotydeus destructor]
MICLLNRKLRLVSVYTPIIQPPNEQLERLIQKLPLGSWFRIYLISKNMDSDQLVKLAKNILPHLNVDGYFDDSLAVTANGNVYDPLSLSSLDHGVPFARRVVTETCVFRLHTHVTSGLFLLLATVVCVRSYFNDPIDCLSRSNDIAKNVLNSVCYVQGTFSGLSAFSKEIGAEVPYPGIESVTPAEQRVYHTYYKWVGWTFLAQAFFFFAPAYLWKCVEQNKTAAILKRLDKEDPYHSDTLSFLRAEKKRENLAILVSYILLELLNTINLIVQVVLLNSLLNHNFIAYGWRMMLTNESPDIRVRTFPDQAKCSFMQFGPSGNVQTYDHLCVLNSNYVYAKLYLLIWFWFHILLILGIAQLVHRVICLSNRKHRLASIYSSIFQSSNDQLDRLNQRLPLGSWFRIYLISKNMDTDQLVRLADKILPHLDREGYFNDKLNVTVDENEKNV